MNGKTIEVECHFGPGKANLTVYEPLEEDAKYRDSDAWLSRGHYHYYALLQIITLKINYEQIGLEPEVIVLYKV